MRVILIITSLLLLVKTALADKDEYVFSGSHFLAACSQLINNGTSTPDNFVKDTMDQGECIGAMKAFMGLSSVLLFCPPKTSVGQMTRVFVKYLNDNPDKLHMPFTYLAHNAFLKAWPCNPR